MASHKPCIAEIAIRPSAFFFMPLLHKKAAQSLPHFRSGGLWFLLMSSRHTSPQTLWVVKVSRIINKKFWEELKAHFRFITVWWFDITSTNILSVCVESQCWRCIGKWMYSSKFSWPQEYLEMITYTPRSLHPLRKGPSYPLDRRLSGPQKRSGLHGKEKFLATTGTRTPTSRSSSS
jgi:hypothetical protein